MSNNLLNKVINKCKIRTKSKLKTQILFMAISIAIAWCLVVGICLYVFSNEYKNLSIMQSQKILGMFVYNFDEEMKKYEELIFNFVSNEEIYDNLYKVNYAQEEYEVYTTQKKLDETLSLYLESNENINGIYYVQNNNQMISSSSNVAHDNEENIKNIMERINEDEKKIVWVQPNEQSEYAYVIRNIYKTQFDWENDLGTLVIAVDINNIADNIQAYTQDVDGFYLINKDAIMMLGDGFKQSIPLKKIQTSKSNIIKDQGNNYLLSKYKSRYSGWEYVNVMNYSSVMNGVVRIIMLMFVILILALIATTLYGLGLTENLLRPIRVLINKANKAILGKYEVEQLPQPANNDEIGTLAYNFNIMLETIDKLINENFAQQLQTKDFRYKMLQAQINPHLLYNTLEIISWRASINGDKETSRIVYALGKLLRNSINSTKMIITIKDELNILGYYIQIEKHRYEERLTFNVDVKEAHINNTIPKLTLQPLVENAIKYGVECKIEGATIQIRSYEKNGDLVLEIADDGIGMPEEVKRNLFTNQSITKGTGIGIKNIHNRIKAQYGEKYGLEVESEQGIGTTVRIYLPFTEC